MPVPQLSRQKPGTFKKRYVPIKKNREFSYLFKKGASLSNPLFVCYYKLSRRRVNRLGIITSKKVGNAVKRARARRVIREAFRLLEPGFKQQTDKRYDFVIVARAAAADAKTVKTAQVKAQLERAFARVLSQSAQSAQNTAK